MQPGLLVVHSVNASVRNIGFSRSFTISIKTPFSLTTVWAFKVDVRSFSDMREILTKFKPDTVIHLAAKAIVEPNYIFV